MLTPCYGGDLARLTLLRESADAVGVPFTHVLVVHDEDRALFRSLERSGVEVVPSSAVLGRDLDARRQRGRRRWRRALPARLGGGVGGWWTQQVVKLAVGERLGIDDWLCVDSDSVFLRPMTEADLRSPDGRLYLQEHAGLGIGRTVREFHRVSAELLGLVPAELDPTLSYVSWPVPICGAVVASLHAWLEERHGLPWVEVFLRSGATEYPVYGYFARYVDGLTRVVAADHRWAKHIWSPDPAVVARELAEARAEGELCMAMIHGGLGLRPESYRHLVLGAQ